MNSTRTAIRNIGGHRKTGIPKPNTLSTPWTRSSTIRNQVSVFEVARRLLSNVAGTRRAAFYGATDLRRRQSVGERVHHHLRRRSNLLSLHHGICSRVGSARNAVLRRHLQCSCVAGSTCGADAGQAYRKGVIALDPGC